MSNPMEDALRRVARGLKRRIKDALGRGPAPSGPPHVEFVGAKAGPVPEGTTVLDAAKLLGVDLNHYCGGTCSCGTCRVEITEGHASLSRQEPREKMVLGAVHVERGDRLACQARVLGTVSVKVPAWF